MSPFPVSTEKETQLLQRMAALGIAESDLQEWFIRGGGPGGQKTNKTSSTVCLRHKVELVSECPHCCKSNVRNRASTVVVGYCTSCGGFLGDAKAAPATPQALWVARQVGQMLATPPRVASDGVAKLLAVIIERMAQGNVAAFAQKLGLSKSGVWHWVRKGGLPTLPAWLGIALHGGIGLERLFAGELSNWQLPTEPVQFSMPLSASPRKGIQSRELDWEAIRQQLRAMLLEETPLTLADACLRTGLDHKLLYLRANTEARAIVDRYQRHQAASRKAKEVRLQAQDRKSTRLNSSHLKLSRMPSSA